MTPDDRDDASRRPRRRAWPWRRRARRARRAILVFDSRRRSDGDRTRSAAFDPTGTSRHLIYRIGDNDIAVSAYLQADHRSVSLSLTGQVLGPSHPGSSIGARTEDGRALAVAVTADGGFEFDCIPGRSVRLEHRRGNAVVTLGEIEMEP